jgi:hypothetical protein
MLGAGDSDRLSVHSTTCKDYCQPYTFDTRGLTKVIRYGMVD